MFKIIKSTGIIFLILITLITVFIISPAGNSIRESFNKGLQGQKR